MISLLRLGLLATCAALGACADLQTISRRTTVPGVAAPDGKVSKPGLAIHLDAQQRLVSYNGLGKYCAEPSPDALAAYASSLGLGASAPGYGSASAAAAVQSAVASIGLRTQSITLMRDALYRLCEAYVNGELSDVSATMLLARSQDLTAVVVAVEQLTGAIAANQAILTPNASSSASAQLVSNQQLLEAARKDEAEKEKTLTAAKKARDDQKKVVDAKAGEAASARAAYENAAKQVPKPSDDELARLKTKQTTEEDNVKAEQAKLKDLEAEVTRREELLAESRRIREIIQDNKDAALTQAVAATGSSGLFSTPVQAKTLNEAASVQIAKSVQAMVKEVLTKDYTTDACSTLLTSEKLSGDRAVALKETVALCIRLINSKIEAQDDKVRISAYGLDGSTDRIEAALAKDTGLRPRLNAWLADQTPGLRIPDLLSGRENAALRRRAVSELRIP